MADDIEANFFEERQAQHGVRRDTIVQELNAEDIESVQRVKSDACINLFYEAILGGCILGVVLQDQQGPQVNNYLIWLLALNGICYLLKTVLFYLTPHWRPINKTELYKLGVQMLQGLLNVILFILSYAVFDNIQWWFWDDPKNQKDFLASTVGIVLGCIQYYWLFLMGCVIILALIFVTMALCSGQSLMNPFRVDHDLNNDGQSQVQRQNTNAALGKMSRIFDFNKFKDHEECVICLEPFEPSEMVTPLPCDKRHYFHSKCIEEWSQNHNTCPLCKTVYSSESLEAAARNRLSLTEPPPQQQHNPEINHYSVGSQSIESERLL